MHFITTLLNMRVATVISYDARRLTNKLRHFPFDFLYAHKELSTFVTIMAEVLFITEAARRGLRRERVFLDRSNPLERLDDRRLIADYRFPRKTILEIVAWCQPLSRYTRRSQALPVHLQVLAALRFYAKGLFQKDLSTIVGVSQSQLSRTIKAVTGIICQRAYEVIRFPRSDADIRKLKTAFHSLAGFPNVFGLIDGSLIKIQSPHGLDEPSYVSRKGGHAINVQVVCDSDMKFINVVKKWPGSTHDSFIWRNCGVRQRFVDMPPSGWLLGDSGYGCEPWLLPVFADPNTPAKEAYNKSHVRTRRLVENSIGLWKSVFRRIHETGGVMMYSPSSACKIITATAVLHNLRRDLKLKEDDDIVRNLRRSNDENVCDANLHDGEITVEGNRVREHVVRTHFTV